jgi:hypothetical protein
VNDNNEQQIKRLQRLLSAEEADLTDEEKGQSDQLLRQLAEICVDHLMAARKKGYRSQADLDAYVRGNLEISPSGERLVKHIPDIGCPHCGNIIRAPLTVARPTAATSFESCLRKCENCHAGWSNAKTNPVMCMDRPTRSVPPQVRTHLDEVLDSALNIRNRINKAAKFCFETSEDAVTWTLFRGMQVERALPGFLNAILPGVTIPDNAHLSMLLWGCPVPPGAKTGEELKADLIAVSNEVNENRSSRTEPDVVIDAGDAGVIFIEVKLHSGNEVRSNELVFNRYLDQGAFSDGSSVTKSGYYELVRNWRLGTAMARNRPFHLVNLGPGIIFDDPRQQDRWQVFMAGIGAQNGRHFHRARWDNVLSTLSDPTLAWIREFVQKRLDRHPCPSCE